MNLVTFHYNFFIFYIYYFSIISFLRINITILLENKFILCFHTLTIGYNIFIVLIHSHTAHIFSPHSISYVTILILKGNMIYMYNFIGNMEIWATLSLSINMDPSIICLLWNNCWVLLLLWARVSCRLWLLRRII